MAKMRVHELAKELEIKSQEIIEALSGTAYEVKSASSNIEDAAQDIIRKKYKKNVKTQAEQAPKAEAKPAAAPKAEQPKEASKSGESSEHERPKKKSSITAVFNAQYSRQNAGHGNGNRRPNQGPRNQRPDRADGARRPQGDRPQQGRGAQQPKQAMSGQDMRKYFDSLLNPNAGKTAEPAPKTEEKKTAEPAETIQQTQERVFKKTTENVYE